MRKVFTEPTSKTAREFLLAVRDGIEGQGCLGKASELHARVGGKVRHCAVGTLDRSQRAGRHAGVGQTVEVWAQGTVGEQGRKLVWAIVDAHDDLAIRGGTVEQFFRKMNKAAKTFGVEFNAFRKDGRYA